MDRFASIAVFVAAVEEGSLAAAGRRFDLSASMAGKYLSQLEAELNVRLLQRSTRSLSLTDAGRAYYVRCKHILEEFDDANREASDAQRLARGTLRVAAPVTFGELHLGDVVTRYLADHPHVDIDISLDDRYVDLQSDAIDVAIRIGRLPDSQLVARRLAPCRMVLCASADFLAREGTPTSPDDLQNTPRLAFSEAVTAGAWSLLDEDGRQHVIEGPLRLRANNMQMLSVAALAGMGVAYGPTFVFGEDIKAGRLVALLPRFKAPELAIHAVFSSARYVPSKVRHFIDYLAAAFGDEPVWDAF
ncbi:LysR family transcriptional regulator [Paraburkholderia sp. BCC1884]|uniref:LysR family transcriptional regulator n=1 Tax=Paraburkholderia sp. BCC1884 TaxID=2562668 RepID=UPI00118459D2|nr:LysR family transcriptional regulator [Paraburkholderia sp. BCC1884]